MKMRAALWYGPEQMKVEEIPVPQIGPGEVLVKVGTALTCGTDFKLFRQGHALLVKDIPSPFGHELAGTVAQVGAGVKNFKEGDRVVTANSAPCGHCFYCQLEKPNLCDNLEFLNGAYAEYIRIPARIVQKNLYKISDELSFRDAALSEPLSCVLHGLDHLPLRPNSSLCIIGAGTCGLLFAQLGKLYGVRVISVGRGEEKLRLAKKFGAEHIFSALEEGYEEAIRAVTPEGRGPDIVIDAAGRPATWELATRLVRKGGHVCFYGGCAKGTQVSLDTHRLHYDEITCAGVFHHTPKHFEKALGLIEAGKIDVDSLIVGQKSLSELGSIFQKGQSTNPLKIAIIP